MNVLEKLISIAESEVGLAESPKGSNDISMNHEFWGERDSYQDLPWCVVWIWHICRKAGVWFPDVAHCTLARQTAQNKENGYEWVTDGYRRGDFFIMPGDSHIGLIVDYDERSNSYKTIEGNYGDAVSRVVRKPGEFAGAMRPDYSDHNDYADDQSRDEEETEKQPVKLEITVPQLMFGDSGKAVEQLQFLLNVNGYEPGYSLMKSGRFDGEFGSGTASALFRFQYDMMLEENGCGEETWKRLFEGVV